MGKFNWAIMKSVLWKTALIFVVLWGCVILYFRIEFKESRRVAPILQKELNKCVTSLGYRQVEARIHSDRSVIFGEVQLFYCTE